MTQMIMFREKSVAMLRTTWPVLIHLVTVEFSVSKTVVRLLPFVLALQRQVTLYFKVSLFHVTCTYHYDYMQVTLTI